MLESDNERDQPIHNDEEELLGRLVCEYMDRLVDGDSIDEEQILKDHPNVGPAVLLELKTFTQMGGPSETDDSPPLGTLGDYTLRRQIGRGGMGVVYEAWQVSMDRQVALKVLPVGIAADTQACTRFMREAQTAGKLNHQNIVGVHSTGVEEGTPWYSMEYVQGETLAQVLGKLKEAGPDTETPFGTKDEVAYFHNMAKAFADVADGLQHAHSKGVIHRDIKPSNLILDDQGRLRILDFGLARLEGQESLTLSGDVVGTPAYMSPEQARRRKIPVDRRTDIYSLGATLYELLTHQQPFRGKDHNDTLSQIIERDPRPPRQLNARVPQDLETVVLKCLRKDIGDRYGTAEALGQDLRRFVRGDAIEARRRSDWEHIVGHLKRHRRTCIVTVTSLVLALLVGRLVIERQNAARERNLAEYEPAVREAVLKIFADRLSRKSAAEAALRQTRVQPGSGVPLRTEDFHPAEFGPHGRVEQAVTILENVIATLPDRRDAHFHLARAYLLLERKEAARRALLRTLECDPAFLPAEVIRWEVEEKSEGRRKSFEEISARYKGTDGWENWWLLARLGEHDGKWFEVAGAYRELVALRDRGEEPYIGFSIDALMGHGAALLQTGDFVGAQRAFIAAGTLAPNSVEPDLFLAKAYYQAGDPERADALVAELYEHASPEDKRRVALWLTAVYKSLLDYTRALDWAAQVGDEATRDRLKMFFLLRLGETGRALELGRKIVAGNSRDPVAYRLFEQALLDDLRSCTGEKRDERLSELLGVTRHAMEFETNHPVLRQLRQMAEEERKTMIHGPTMATITIFAFTAALANAAQAQQGFFDDVKQLGEINTPVGEQIPVISADGLELYFTSVNRPGGEGDFDIWVAKRETADEPFDLVENVEELNSVFGEAVWSLSADGLTVYLDSDDPSGKGSNDIYLARRPSRDEPFGKPEPLDQFNTVHREWAPTVTADGLELYFGRETTGEWDLYVSRRDSFEEPFPEPTALQEINTAFGDANPSISPDGLTLFWSDAPGDLRPGGRGLLDIWMATRLRRVDDFGDPVPFGPALNVGQPLNTGAHEGISSISADWPASGSKIYFGRGFGLSSFDLYEATWHLDCNQNTVDDVEDIDGGIPDVNQNGMPDECEAPSESRFLRGECNDDGSVDVSDASCILNWQFLGGPAPGCIAAVNTNGDRGIDIADAIYLLGSLFLGGPPPVQPFPACGPGALPLDAQLGCAAPSC